MNPWLWIILGLGAGGVLLLALKLWGPQILAGLAKLAWQAIMDNAKGLETPEELAKRVREGRERGGKDR